MATERRINNLASGFETVFYIGCETDASGYPAVGTADRIVKRWSQTRADAEQVTVGEVTA